MASSGIFCLEGDWEDGLDSRLSVQPLLELLDALNTDKKPTRSFHSHVATWSELKYYIGRWTKAPSSKYNVAYFAFHGLPGGIALDRDDVTLTEIAEILGRGAEGRTIYFGSCGTLGQPEADLRRFCKQTGVRGLVGYTETVGWSESAAFDLLLLPELIRGAALKPMVARLSLHHPRFVEGLGLRVATSAWVLPGDATPA